MSVLDSFQLHALEAYIDQWEALEADIDKWEALNAFIRRDLQLLEYQILSLSPEFGISQNWWSEPGCDWVFPQRQIQSMSPGFMDTIYLTSDGSVWTMGRNRHGQLGNGAIGDGAWSSVPVHVNLPGPMQEVGCGHEACWSLSADGLSAYAWGDNRKGQLGIGDRSVRYSTTPVQIRFDLPPGVSIVSMADGLWSNLALLSNGQVLGWGDNGSGQCGLDPSVYGKHIFAPTVMPGLTGVASLAVGDYYSLALKSNGTVWAWGDNGARHVPSRKNPPDANGTGELGPNGGTAPSWVPVRVTGLPPIQTIIAGGRNGVALDFSGHVWEWGRNDYGELGNGSIDSQQRPHPEPSMVQGLPPIVSIDSQGPTVVAADANGDIYTWGYNKWGAVGDGGTTDAPTPQLVLHIPPTPGFPDSVHVAAAHRSIYAFNDVTGETYAWGENTYGQIGIPANDSPNPLPVNITGEILPTLPIACATLPLR